EDPPHLLVTDFALLQADAEVVLEQLAICAGQPGRDVGVLVDDVESNRKSVAWQQPRIEVHAHRRLPNLIWLDVREHFDTHWLCSVRYVDVAAGHRGETDGT